METYIKSKKIKQDFKAFDKMLEKNLYNLYNF